MHLKYNTKVEFKREYDITGKGLIKGVSSESVMGTVYIIEVIDSNINIPNKFYPYTHIMMCEKFFTKIEEN
jgi:hypothetical protein